VIVLIGFEQETTDSGKAGCGFLKNNGKKYSKVVVLESFNRGCNLTDGNSGRLQLLGRKPSELRVSVDQQALYGILLRRRLGIDDDAVYQNKSME